MTWWQRIGKSDIRNILAVVITVGVFILMYLLIIKPIPELNKDVVMTAVGFVFGGALAGVVGFYFGAAKSNKEEKEEL